MKRTLSSLFLLGLLLAALPVAAYDLGGANVLVPIAGRAPGAHGSQWRTDLVITNQQPSAVRLFITLHSAGSESFVDRVIAGHGTIVLEDVLRTTFLQDTATGMIRVSSGSPEARFVARAYIYNRGNAAGEFGQGVPAVPIDALGQEHVLSGVFGGAARRTNVGIANPWPTEVDAIITLHGPAGELLGQQARTIAAQSVVQINDVFASFEAMPWPEASLRIHSSLGVYTYASVVRNDTGDAVFVPGSGIRIPEVGLAPVCASPAALLMPYRDEAPAEESVVIVRASLTKEYVLGTILPRHGIVASEYIDAAHAFKAVLTPQQIAALRCESAVEVIRRDGLVPQE